MLHVPLLRAGVPYYSMDTAVIRDFQTGEPLVRVSQANSGLIAKDLSNAGAYKLALEDLSLSELLIICKRAAHIFAASTIGIDGYIQTPEDYVKHTSATTGMPHALCRKNMAKVFLVLDNMQAVIEGLTRRLDIEVLDRGYARTERDFISYMPVSNVLGAILPNNSPGVHTLWLPSIPLKTPVALKPGREEPWTPFRIAQAFIAAGRPPQAFNYYPTSHAGANEILLRCARLMLFGDENTVRKWQGDQRVQVHGPGRSKVIIGADHLADWEQHIDPIITSIVENGGRSCINASGVWVSGRSREVAESLARVLAEIEPLPMNHPDAQLAAFTNPAVAERISRLIDQSLAIPGAEDVTTKLRGGSRLVQKEGCTYLLPTVIHCTGPDHPLANTEFLFPFCSVVQAPEADFVNRIGPSLVVTAITENEQLIQRLLTAHDIDRLNLGAVPTTQVSWYQPHEGNLFEHLYRQRAFYQQNDATKVLQ